MTAPASWRHAWRWLAGMWMVAVCALSTARLAPAQDELLAEFDRLEASWAAAPPAERPALASRVSAAFLRLPDSAERTRRLAAGAAATLAAGRAEMALEMTPTDWSGVVRDRATLLTIRLRALAQLGRLLEFSRLLRQQVESSPDAVTNALRLEEGRLLPLAAAALRTRDRPAGRMIFQYLATLQPIQSYRVANLGLCLRQIGDLEAAFQTYELGRRIAPEDLVLRNDYGLLLRASKRWPEALDAFRESVALDLARPEPQRGKGPGITNLMHAEILYPGMVGRPSTDGDPIPTAALALEKRPKAILLRRLMLDLSLDRLALEKTGK